jgi:hypothetical protein
MTRGELAEHVARFATRLEFIRALGISRNTLNVWLRGEVAISPKMATRIRALPTPPPAPPRRRAVDRIVDQILAPFFGAPAPAVAPAEQEGARA